MGSILSKPEPEYVALFYYKIVYRKRVIYVGRTFDFMRRSNEHKNASNKVPKYPWSTENNTPLYRRIRQIGGWDKVTMILLETRDEKCRYEMCARETHWIQRHLSKHLTNVILHSIDH